MSQRAAPSRSDDPIKIGVVGTGFISRNFAYFVDGRHDFEITRVLTRRQIDTCNDHPLGAAMTNSVDELLDHADVVFECTGDPIYATEVVDATCRAGLPCVTMNTEFHVTAGSYFVDKGLISEAEGDQPGCQASLREEAVELGFRPLVYGNLKGFQNLTPTPEEMAYWSERQGTSIAMTTSFTDGTKIQFEQALVANGCGATFAVPGMVGIETEDIAAGAQELAARASVLETPISDYLLSLKLPHGVFVVGEHDERQRPALKYNKLGEGPYYVLLRPNIFVHLEILKTVRRVVVERRGFLDNSKLPRISVSTVAKQSLEPGTRIDNGIGSFEVRGVGVDIVGNAGHLPIGLAANVVVRRRLEPGETLSLDDVEIDDSLALRAWREVERSVLSARESGVGETTEAHMAGQSG